jgi:hypothetical protein
MELKIGCYYHIIEYGKLYYGKYLGLTKDTKFCSMFYYQEFPYLFKLYKETVFENINVCPFKLENIVEEISEEKLMAKVL